MTDQDRKNAPTTDKLRSDIDSGKAGDKVDHPDPAAAPLGTDDEAAGVGVSRARRVEAYEKEIAGRDGPDKERSWAMLAGGIGLAVLVAVLILFGVS